MRDAVLVTLAISIGLGGVWLLRRMTAVMTAQHREAMRQLGAAIERTDRQCQKLGIRDPDQEPRV